MNRFEVNITCWYQSMVALFIQGFFQWFMHLCDIIMLLGKVER
nr:MAG TPA: hypothetical protein [Caudoviricetes sp.]